VFLNTGIDLWYVALCLIIKRGLNVSLAEDGDILLDGELLLAKARASSALGSHGRQTPMATAIFRRLLDGKRDAFGEETASFSPGLGARNLGWGKSARRALGLLHERS